VDLTLGQPQLQVGKELVVEQARVIGSCFWGAGVVKNSLQAADNTPTSSISKGAVTWWFISRMAH
jgi:hypothetical protein